MPVKQRQMTVKYAIQRFSDWCVAKFSLFFSILTFNPLNGSLYAQIQHTKSIDITVHELAVHTRSFHIAYSLCVLIRVCARPK